MKRPPFAVSSSGIDLQAFELLDRLSPDATFAASGLRSCATVLRLWLEQPPQCDQIVERHHLGNKSPIEDRKHDRRHHSRPHELDFESVHLWRTWIGAAHHISVLFLGADTPGYHGKKHQPPDYEIDGQDRDPRHHPPHACSSSTNVPRKSLGCRNSTGLPWAPILGSPSPNTRAPSALRRSRAAMMSSTS